MGEAAGRCHGYQIGVGVTQASDGCQVGVRQIADRCHTAFVMASDPLIHLPPVPCFLEARRSFVVAVSETGGAFVYGVLLRIAGLR